MTIHAGADDERDDGETSLANVDLYNDLPGKIRNFSPGTDQSAFYMKLDYKVIFVSESLLQLAEYLGNTEGSY